MRKEALLGFLLSGLLLAAQPANVNIAGVTNTQAILSYNSPDDNDCRLEVSESPSFLPLVHDVDPSIFSGANTDSRLGNVSSGEVASMHNVPSGRKFVIGKRGRAYLGNVGANAGKYFSRALRANTMHYYRLTCSGGNVTGSFTTANTPLGNGYNDVLLADPTNPGAVPMPQFISPTDRTETVVDTDSGFGVQRIMLEQDTWDGYSYVNQVLNEASSSDSTWTSPSSVFASDGNSASATSGSGFLWAGFNDSRISHGGPQQFDYLGANFAANNSAMTPGAIDYYRMHVKGTMTGCSVSPCNQVTVCAGLRDGTCYTTPTDVVLDGTDRTIGMFAPGTAGYDPDLNGAKKVTRFAAFTHVGNVATAGGSSSVALTGGTYFDTNWQTGDRIRLSNVSTADACLDSGGGAHEFGIASVKDGMHLSVVGAVDASYNYYCASNFGIIVRRKTPDGNRANLDYLTVDVAVSAGGGASFEATSRQCNTALISGGYYCHVPVAVGNTYFLYHINPTTNVVTPIGPWIAPAKTSGADQWFPNGALFLSTSSGIDVSQSTLTAYALIRDTNGKHVLARMTYSGPPMPQGNAFQLGGGTCTSNVPDAYSVRCVNGAVTVTATVMTPASLSKNVLSLITAYNPNFDSTLFNDSTLAMYAMENGQIEIHSAVSQDSRGWQIIFDPGDGNPANAGSTGMHIVGMRNTWSNTGCRWAVQHATSVQLNSGPPPYWVFACYPSRGNPANFGTGPWQVTTHDSIERTPSTTCPANNLGAPTTGTACTTVNIDSHGGTHPFEPFYAGTNASEPAYLQDAQVGDVVVIGSTSPCMSCPLTSGTETTYLVQKNGASWVLWRGQFGTQSTAFSGAGVKYLTMGTDALQNTNPPQVLNGGLAAWRTSDPPTGSFAVDPFNYQAHSFAVKSMLADYSDDQALGLCGSARLQGGASSCVRVRYQNGSDFATLATQPIHYVNVQPPFAGIFSAVGSTGNTYPSHVTPPAAGVGADNSWFSDSRAFVNPMSTTTWTLVPGTASVYMATNLTLNRKQFFTQAVAGPHLLTDISSPATGNQIADARPWTYCVASASNECRAGSSAGDVYVSAPNRTFLSCQGAGVSGNMFDVSGNSFEDICVNDSFVFAATITQQFGDKDDPFGSYSRRVSSMIGWPKRGNGFSNDRIRPDGKAILMQCLACDGFASPVLMVNIPPRPPADSVNRSQFVPLEINVHGIPGADGIVADFGYMEYGSDGSTGFFCTTRQETCVSHQSILSAVAGTTPFHFVSESFSPAFCPSSGSCKLVIPAISGRVVYYRIRRTQAGVTVAGGPTEVSAVP